MPKFLGMRTHIRIHTSSLWMKKKSEKNLQKNIKKIRSNLKKIRLLAII
jgi:hypothetical protein